MEAQAARDLAAAAALDKHPAPPALVDALLEEAGRPEPWSVVTVATPGRVNTTTIVEVGGGERFAVRVYGWPFDGDPLFDRRAKEVALARRLDGAGVPVARFLATADVDGAQGAILTWVPGELLGVVARREPADALAGAWREAAAALRRVHDLDPGTTVEGFVTADGVLPFPEGTFADRIVGELVDHARRLDGDASEGCVAAAGVEALAPALHASLSAAPARLAHGDSNPWNVLVARDGGGAWRLSAWLDWEFAWVADPTYDHVRATVQRFADIGATPDAWWEGYGARPPAAHLAAYALHLLLWKGVERLDGIVTPETDRTWAQLPTVDRRVADLRRLLAGGG